MKRSLLLSDLADNDNDCGESVGSSFSYISQHACTDHHYEGISSTASNNEVASSDDSSSDDDGDSSHGGIDARSSSAKKRKWASGTIDDVIEIDSSSESESYSGESDDDDDEIGIIANSVDSGEESKQDNGLPLNDEENDDEYHSDSDSDLSDFPNDGAYAGGESDGDDEVSKAHGESDADAENLDAGEEASIIGNEYGNGSATDNINVEFADASNCDGSDSHKAADDDMMDVNQDEELVANDSGSESDDNSCDEDDNDGEIERFHVSKIKDSKLAMVTQGFRCQANVRRSSAADGDDNNNKDHATTTSENINTLFDPFLVKFCGKTFRKNHCYILKDGDVVTVGIKRFLTNDTAQWLVALGRRMVALGRRIPLLPRLRLLLLQLIHQADPRPSLAGTLLVSVNAVARTILLISATNICLLDSVLSTIWTRRRRSGALRVRQVLLVDPRRRRGRPSPLLRQVWPPNPLPLQLRVRPQSVVLHMPRRPIGSLL